MKFSLRSLGVAVATGTLALAFTGAANANIVLFPSYTSSYGDIVSPGVYMGTGIPNGDWTISTGNTHVELALRAKIRGGATVDGSSGIYHFGPSSTNRAIWNYEFSINTQAGGGTLTLNAVTVSLGVSANGGPVTSVDPVTYWPDNAFWGGPPGSGAKIQAPPQPTALDTIWGAQNSENCTFSAMPGGVCNPAEPGNWAFTMTATDNATGQVLASTTIHVQVPEPATLGLYGAGLLALLGLAAFSRRREAVGAARAV